MTDHVKVTVRVEPDDEPPFEATFRQAFKGADPMEGWQVKVIYDPADHAKIAIQDGRVHPQPTGQWSGSEKPVRAPRLA